MTSNVALTMKVKDTNVFVTLNDCSNDLFDISGPLDEKFALFSIFEQEGPSFIQIQLDDPASSCKQVIARRETQNRYALMTTCIYELNDTNIFRMDSKKKMSIMTPEGRQLFLAVDLNGDVCDSKPKLLFVNEFSDTVVECSSIVFVRQQTIDPQPDTPSKLGAGWIVLIVFAILITLIVVIWLLMRQANIKMFDVDFESIRNAMRQVKTQ